jgi:hypothetical protein
VLDVPIIGVLESLLERPRGALMGVSVGPHEDGPSGKSGPLWGPGVGPPVDVSADRRIGLRVLGIFALVFAEFLGLVVTFSTAFGRDFIYDKTVGPIDVYVVNRVALIGLLVLLVGFLCCLVGSRAGLRWATVCAAVYFVVAVGSGIGWAILDSVLYGFEFGLMYAFPGLILVAGIVAMRPAHLAQDLPPHP